MTFYDLILGLKKAEKHNHIRLNHLDDKDEYVAIRLDEVLAFMKSKQKALPKLKKVELLELVAKEMSFRGYKAIRSNRSKKQINCFVFLRELLPA